MLTPASAAPAAATLPLFPPQAPPDKVSGLLHAATLLAQLLGQGRALDSRALRSAMEAAFGGSDAEGVWVWKDAYEALEAAQVLFLCKFGGAMRARAGSSAAMLDMLTRLAERLPSQTRRSEESQHLQQFSTPITLGFVAAEAAALTSADLVLEPSAGTGLLAIFAELAKARLALNEIAEARAGLVGRDGAVSRHNAEQIHDHLDPAIRPSVVLMNPPFSASPHVEGRFTEAAVRHVGSALARLAEGGRLVAVTGHNVGPDQPAWRDSFVRLQEKGRVVFTATLAGQAYARYGTTIDTRLTVIDRLPAEDPRAFPPSPGKGRQVAGIILDNWLKGRRRAVWISKSDKLIEDAERDWTAVGGYRSDLVPLSRFRQGSAIALEEGILFTTYATLRTQARGEKASRVQQIIDWLGRGFDGVVVFDEAHAMANAAGDKGERGEKKPSQQGLAGLRLQHALHDALILYVSATGATTVQNLAYAARLGLWGTGDFPFATRAEFVAAMEKGGVAAMEVLARDLKALGLYAARSLSFEGIEYEIVEHRLTDEQIRIYDAYADAFQIIHKNLTEALKAANITGADGGTYNRNAKAAARSAFESNKQRFFNHLLTAMKCPTLIARIAGDLEEGHSVVLQVVSTNEALLERRLAEIPTSEWADLSIDITPREYVLDYLSHSFPTQLFELYSDDEGNILSRPAYDADGNPVVSREALERRDRMIEHLASLPPVQGALDQILHRFGTETVAEVTGRSRRIVRRGDRLCVESRPGSANFAETAAFMDDDKRILVFSDAGGTGRSYHADLGCKNQRQRVHNLLEPGWRADAAIQGLGRSNRTNQKQPPIFRPVATDVKGEKRFLSTIARRLDTLGAITRGQRQTGGQGLFRADDNLESAYAKAALRQFYQLLHGGRVEGCSLTKFQDATGLDLLDEDVSVREELPPITQFLNRVLALWIDLQNTLFATFESLLEARIESALAAGTYDIGVETLTAESFRVAERRTVHTHEATGAETRCYRVLSKDRNHPLPLAEAIETARSTGCRLLINTQSDRAAVQAPASSLMHDDGRIEARTRHPADGARDRHARRIRPLALARSHARTLCAAVGGGMRRRPGILRERIPHHHRPPAADLGPAAGREHARLPLRDRRRRTRHRPPRHARGARPRLPRSRGYRSARPLARGGMECRHRARRGARSRRRAAHPPLAGDGRLSCRARRLLGRRRRPAQGARPDLGNHRLASAALRAGRRGSRSADPCRDPQAPSASRYPRPCRRLIGRCSMISQAGDLARRLARDAEAVCRHYLSNGRRCGHYWVAGDVMNTPGRSLYVPGSTALSSAPEPPANGPMPPPASMAISWT
jgi:hypothetical protein